MKRSKVKTVFIQCMCGLPLTDPVSMERGIGPECLKNLIAEGLKIDDFIHDDDIYYFIFNSICKKATVHDMYAFFEIPHKIINVILIRLYKQKRINFRLQPDNNSYYYIEN